MFSRDFFRAMNARNVSVILSLCLLAGPALSFTCRQSADHGMMGLDGVATWAPILLSPADPRPDPDFAQMELGNDTVFKVSKVAVADHVPYLVGRLYFRSEPFVERDVTSPERDWECDYGRYEEGADPVPASVRPALAEALKAVLVEPGSVAISGAMSAVDDPGAAKLACIWLNARNGFGGYAGKAPIAVLYDAAEDFAWIPSRMPAELCATSQPGEPFPELGPAD